MGDDRSGSNQRDVSFRIARGPAGEVVGLTWSSRQIERHDGAVRKVMFYRLDTAQGQRWLLVHVTADNLITDYDVVDKRSCDTRSTAVRHLFHFRADRPNATTATTATTRA
jgi:hypothetical protein